MRDALVCLFCVLGSVPLIARQGHAATSWQHVTTANNVDLAYTLRTETTAQGEQPFIYLLLSNRNAKAVIGNMTVRVTCADKRVVPLVFPPGAIDVIDAEQSFGGFPHLFKDVCSPTNPVAHVDADLDFEVTDEAQPPDAGPVNPADGPPNFVPTLPPPPPPPVYDPEDPSSLEPQGPSYAPEAEFSPGYLLEFRYGIAAMAVPVQGTSIDAFNTISDYQTTAGGLGPRLNIDYWPLYSRVFSVGLAGSAEFDSFGTNNGFTYVTDLAGGLRLQGGDELFFSGLLKLDAGYRSAQASEASDDDLDESGATFSGSYQRIAVDARLCIDARPNPLCRRGLDAGVGYDNLGYATNHGGLFVEGNFWMRDHMAVGLQVGWDYAAGGSTPHPGRAPNRGTYVSVALQFSDTYWGAYGGAPD